MLVCETSHVIDTSPPSRTLCLWGDEPSFEFGVRARHAHRSRRVGIVGKPKDGETCCFGSYVFALHSDQGHRLLSRR